MRQERAFNLLQKCTNLVPIEQVHSGRKKCSSLYKYVNISTFTILQIALYVILAGGLNRNYKRIPELITVYNFFSLAQYKDLPHCTLNKSSM